MVGGGCTRIQGRTSQEVLLPQNPTMIRRPKLGYQKTREKKTSPRAKLQTSGFVFKRTGRWYRKRAGDGAGKRQEKSGKGSAAWHPHLLPGDKRPHLIQLHCKQPASESLDPAGNCPKMTSKIINPSEKFV